MSIVTKIRGLSNGTRVYIAAKQAWGRTYYSADGEVSWHRSQGAAVQAAINDCALAVAADEVAS